MGQMSFQYISLAKILLKQIQNIFDPSDKMTSNKNNSMMVYVRMKKWTSECEFSTPGSCHLIINEYKLIIFFFKLTIN